VLDPTVCDFERRAGGTWLRAAKLRRKEEAMKNFTAIHWRWLKRHWATGGLIKKALVVLLGMHSITYVATYHLLVIVCAVTILLPLFVLGRMRFGVLFEI